MSIVNPFSRLSAIVLAFALAMTLSLGATQKASAANVSFTTTGAWSPSYTSNVLPLGASGATLTYDSAAPFNYPAGTFSYSATFGDFALAAGSSSQVIGNADISITFNQTGPLAGSFVLNGHLFGGGAKVGSSGSLSNGAGNQQAIIVLDQSHFTISGVHYTITASLHNLTGAQAVYNNQPGVSLVQVGSNATIQGNVSGTASVPVPAAAWGGMGLMGLLALGKLRRGVARFV